MKRSIDVIVKYFYPVTAGIETNTLETYSVLAKNGWDITIHTSKDTYLKKDHLPSEEIIRGLKIKRYHFSKFGFFPQIDWSNTNVVALHNFDIFPHVRIMFFGLWQKILGRKNYAMILTPHGGFNPEWTVFGLLSGWIKRIYHYSLGTLLINLVIDGVRGVSLWESSEIIKKGVFRNKVKTIANGLEDEAYVDVEKKASKEIKNKLKVWGKYIVQVGRVYNIKNYETTIKALVDVDPSINYVIVGTTQDEKYLQYLKDLASLFGVSERVIFAGVVKGVDKYYLIKKAQMMVHMALWESFCNVVHEGLSQGLVCIVANNTALPYLIKDGVNGYCVETKDSKAVAEKINYVLKNQNSKLIKDMKARNRKFGLEESWQSTALKMENLYLQLLKK